MSKTKFHLTLEPLPNRGDETVRLRRALKCLLRSFGLRCIEIREEKPEATSGTPAGPAELEALGMNQSQ